ncbi:MAG: hypothetical protein ABGZ17_04575 [Planctomycetaceae bacterium]
MVRAHSAYQPSQDEISQMCLMIRSEWSPQERARRGNWMNPTPWSPMEVRCLSDRTVSSLLTSDEAGGSY